MSRQPFLSDSILIRAKAVYEIWKKKEKGEARGGVWEVVWEGSRKKEIEKLRGL